MFCRKCGTQNPDTLMKCSKCGNDLQAARAASGELQPSISNYLVQAIILTVLSVFCCLSLPFGIVAIVYAAQVNGKLAGGDYDGAIDSSKKAKMWCWISFAIMVVVGIIWAIAIIIPMIMGAGRMY